MALSYVAGAFNKGLGLLSSLDKKSMPDNVKPFRKSLLSARNGLDIFAYAYPETSMKEKKGKGDSDVFRLLRKDLNDGYTLVGNFQDLENVNYTKKDFETRLEACLTWKKTFETDISKYNYKSYVQSASTKKLFDRKKADLSRDFWGNVPATPSLSLNGYQNVAVLGGGQIQEAVNYYDATYNLTEIWDTKYHTEFHDYRKLLRSIEFVGTEFPQIFNANVTIELNLIDTAYGTFGNLNDLINEYVYYHTNGDSKKADKKKAEVISSWNTLKSWLTTNNFRSKMATLGTKLIPTKTA